MQPLNIFVFLAWPKYQESQNNIQMPGSKMPRAHNRCGRDRARTEVAVWVQVQGLQSSQTRALQSVSQSGSKLRSLCFFLSGTNSSTTRKRWRAGISWMNYINKWWKPFTTTGSRPRSLDLSKMSRMKDWAVPIPKPLMTQSLWSMWVRAAVVVSIKRELRRFWRTWRSLIWPEKCRK